MGGGGCVLCQVSKIKKCNFQWAQILQMINSDISWNLIGVEWTAVIWYLVGVAETFLKLIFQFVAANDKLHFMFEIGSFVDYFTIPPMFVSIFLDRTWIGKFHILCKVSDLLSTFNCILTCHMECDFHLMRS